MLFGDVRDESWISIHALHEESDLHLIAFESRYEEISIHALHEESDLKTPTKPAKRWKFQSTLSMRRATARADQIHHQQLNFNPRSP